MSKLIPFKDTYLTLSHYKEPLREVPSSVGYGYYGALLGTLNGSTIQCHLCGELYRDLSMHLRGTHKMKVTEYREKFQLARQTALISEEIRQTRKIATLKWQANLTVDERLEFKRKREAGFLKWKRKTLLCRRTT